MGENLFSKFATVTTAKFKKICLAERRQDGVRRDPADGGYGAIQRGVACRHEAALGRRRRAGVLRPLQRVPAQRFSQIVSRTYNFTLPLFV